MIRSCKFTECAVGRKFLKKTVCRNVKKCRFYFTSLIIKWNYEVLTNWNKDYGALFDYHIYIYVYIGIYAYVYVYVYIYMCIYMYIYIFVRIKI